MIVEASVTLPPGQIRTSKAGNPWAEFYILDKEKERYRVLCFGEVAESVCSRLSQGDEVVVTGSLDDSEGEKVIKAKLVEDEKRKSDKAKRNEEKVEAAKARAEAERERSSKYRIRVMDRWIPVIDFLCLFYGADRITKALRKKGIGIDPADFNKEDYENFLERGILKIQDQTHLYIQEFSWTL